MTGVPMQNDSKIVMGIPSYHSEGKIRARAFQRYSITTERSATPTQLIFFISRLECSSSDFRGPSPRITSLKREDAPSFFQARVSVRISLSLLSRPIQRSNDPR